MKRTPPKLEDLHPWLREKVEKVAEKHQLAFPGRALCLIWGHRSKKEQRAAYEAGYSKLDGYRKVGLHNYYPSLAADLWVYIDAPEFDQVLVEGRLKRGTYERLCLMRRGDFKNYYLPLAKIAKAEGLEAGALWRRFKDGPHVQVPRLQRNKLCQKALQKKGLYYGLIDGIIGPKSRAAIRAAYVHSGIEEITPPRMLPVTPELWTWLHKEI